MQKTVVGVLIIALLFGLPLSRIAAAQSNPETTESNEVGTRSLSSRFQAALALQTAGELADAISSYQGLIQDYPSSIEAYINLASILAKTGELEQARRVLERGTQANKNTRVLFDSVNKLYGALAAKAYRNALETPSKAEATIELPVVTDLAILNVPNSVAQEPIVSTRPAAQVEPTEIDLPAINQTVEAQLIVDLIKQWATAQSQKNLEAYIDFYQDGYTPDESTSYAHWLVNQRERFATEPTIIVIVDGFSVVKEGAGYVVTFNEHRHSEASTETLEKRLSLALIGVGKTPKITREMRVQG